MLEWSQKISYGNDVDGARMDAKHLHHVFSFNDIADVQQHAEYLSKSQPFLAGQLRGSRATGFPCNGQQHAMAIEGPRLEQTIL